MVQRVAPHKFNNNATGVTTKKSRSVSFGESIVHSVDSMVSSEEAPLFWYKKKELNDLLELEKEGLRKCNEGRQYSKKKSTRKPCANEEHFTPRGLESKLLTPGRSNHVRHVLRIYHLKQKRAPVDPEELRKTARHSSKKNETVALEQGRRDYIEAHGKQSLLGRAKARVGMLF